MSWQAQFFNIVNIFVIPREKRILFSVCLSVRLYVRLSVSLSGTLFSHFVRVTPPTVSITHKPNRNHLKAGCLECVRGVSFSAAPPKYWRNRSLETAQNHKFQFLEPHKSMSFGPRNAIPIRYESPASVV